MNKKLASVSVLAMAALGALGGGIAYAASGPPVDGGPPTVQGLHYAPGDIVYLCVNQVTETVRAEVHTVTPFNCTTNEVQLPVVVPSPYPSPGAP